MPLIYVRYSGPSVFAQQLDEGGVVLLRCDAERGVAFGVEGDEVCALFDEELAQWNGAFHGGEHEERPAVLVGQVGIEVLIERGAKGLFGAALDHGLGCAIGEGHDYSANCCGFLPKSAPK